MKDEIRAQLRALGVKHQDQPEDELQIQVANYLRVAAYPSVVWWHTPNGGKRHKAEAARFQAMGVIAGIPDISLVDGGRYYGLELKTRTGPQSQEQKDIERRLASTGAPYRIARSLDDAVAILTAWNLVKGSSL